METVSAEILNVIIRIKWTKYLLKIQKSGRHLLQMVKSRHDRHQSPDMSIGWGFANHFRFKVHLKDANEFEK